MFQFVIDELQGNTIQNLHDSQTQTCNDCVDDLAFFASATLREIMKELSKRNQGSLRRPIGNEVVKFDLKEGEHGYEFDQPVNPEDCCREMLRLQQIVKQIMGEKVKLEDELNLKSKDCETLCAETLKEMNVLKDENNKLKSDNGKLISNLQSHGIKLDDLQVKVGQLDKEMAQNDADINYFSDSLKQTMGLVEDISDAQLRNEKLRGAVDTLSAPDQKLMDDLRRQLRECQEKKRLCEDQNDSYKKHLQNLGVDISTVPGIKQGDSARGGQPTDGAGAGIGSGGAGAAGTGAASDSPVKLSEKPGVAGVLIGAGGITQPETVGKPGAGVAVVGLPGAGQPGAAQPGAGVAVVGQPGAGVAVVGQPGAGQPGAGLAVVGQPGAAQPGAGQPGIGQPGAGVAVVGQPGAALPGAGVAGAALPGAGKPGAGQPGAGVAGAGVAGAGVAGAGVAGAGGAVVGQPGAPQPGAGQAGAGLAVVGQPGAAQPGTGQAGAGLAVAGQPGAVQPGAGQPGAGQLGTGQPGAVQPGSGPAGAGLAGVGQAGAGQLGPGQAGAVDPFSAAQPGTGQTGAGQPGAGILGAGPLGSPGGKSGKGRHSSLLSRQIGEIGKNIVVGAMSSPFKDAKLTATGGTLIRPVAGKGLKATIVKGRGRTKEDERASIQEFVKKNAPNLNVHLKVGGNLEKELKNILENFISECGFCFCSTNVPKSKFYVICHKIVHQGVQYLTFNELSYMHKKIYMAAERIHPGCLLSMVLSEQQQQQNLEYEQFQKQQQQFQQQMKLQQEQQHYQMDQHKLKCCNCRSVLCCSNSEEMLKEKVNKLERDIEMAKEYLDSLRIRSSRQKTYRKYDKDDYDDDGYEEKNATYRQNKPVSKYTNRQLKNLKARFMKGCDGYQ